MRDIWISENQVKHEEAILKAVREYCTVAILDHPGTGFKFSLQRVCQLRGGIRSAIVQISMKSKHKEIGITMLKQILSIRFSNLKSTNISVFELIMVVGARVRQDLKGKRVLLIFERVHYLNEPGRLSHFLDLLDNINFPCGIILRFDLMYPSVVKTWGDQHLYDRFERVTFLRKVTRPNTSWEIRQMLMIHGLNNPDLLSEISSNTKSFTTAKLLLGKKFLYKPSLQLNLFTENRLRI